MMKLPPCVAHSGSRFLTLSGSLLSPSNQLSSPPLGTPVTPGNRTVGGGGGGVWAQPANGRAPWRRNWEEEEEEEEPTTGGCWDVLLA
ncbi:UNVERIFIED_CONTAM: hypothetical protein FKN15_034543 [Acipenser sinensis]